MLKHVFEPLVWLRVPSLVRIRRLVTSNDAGAGVKELRTPSKSCQDSDRLHFDGANAGAVVPIAWEAVSVSSGSRASAESHRINIVSRGGIESPRTMNGDGG